MPLAVAKGLRKGEKKEGPSLICAYPTPGIATFPIYSYSEQQEGKGYFHKWRNKGSGVHRNLAKVTQQEQGELGLQSQSVHLTSDLPRLL